MATKAIPQLTLDPQQIELKILTNPAMAALAGGLPRDAFAALRGYDPDSEIAVLLADLRKLAAHFGKGGVARRLLAASAVKAARDNKVSGGSFEGFLHGFGNVLKHVAPVVATLAPLLL